VRLAGRLGAALVQVVVPLHVLLLEFDFEASAQIARAYGLALARMALAEEQVAHAEALWSRLVDLSTQTGTRGGKIDTAAGPDMWREYLREVIPPLFGARFSPGKLERGYRPAGQHPDPAEHPEERRADRG
jgi:hypothetical protein